MEPWRELKVTKNKNECARLYLLIIDLAPPTLGILLNEVLLYDIKNIYTTKDIKKMEKFLNHVYTSFYNKSLDKNKNV